mgnify:FL=1
MFTMRAMKTYRSAQTQGFFDVELRVPWLEAKDNPLSRLDTVIDWEGFRPLLEQALAEPPAKQRQKDVDARWTKKNAEVHYGDKNNLKADAQSKLIERYAVTDASMHDSQSATGSGGPCACGKAAEGCRSPRRSRVKFTREPRRQQLDCGSPQPLLTTTCGPLTATSSRLHERAYRNRPLSDEQKASGSASSPGGIQPGGEPTDQRESNRQKSKLRARTCLRASTHRQIEHIFGFISQSMKGFYLRYLVSGRKLLFFGVE